MVETDNNTENSNVDEQSETTVKQRSINNRPNGSSDSEKQIDTMKNHVIN